MLSKKLILLFNIISISWCCHAQVKKLELPLNESDRREYILKGTKLIEPCMAVEGGPLSFSKQTLEDAREGIRYLDAVTQTDSNIWLVYFFKGEAHQALKNYKQAYVEFEKAYRLNKDNKTLGRELVHQCLRLGKGKEAVEVGLRTVKIDGTNAGLIGNLAIAYLINGDLDLARTTINKALSINPKDRINLKWEKTILAVIEGKRPRPTRI